MDPGLNWVWDEEKLDNWEFHKGVRRNIRSLLIKLPDLMGPDSGWKPVSLGDLVQVNKVRKHYKRAIMLTHPDRSQHRGDPVQKQLVYRRAFEAMNAAWKEHEKTMKGSWSRESTM